MKGQLLKRQEELKKEFNLAKQKGQEFSDALEQIKVYLNQLSGAYNEIDKQLKEMESKTNTENSL